MTDGVLKQSEANESDSGSSLFDFSSDSESDSFGVFFSSSSSLISLSSSSFFSGDELWSEFSLSSFSDQSNDANETPAGKSNNEQDKIKTNIVADDINEGNKMYTKSYNYKSNIADDLNDENKTYTKSDNSESISERNIKSSKATQHDELAPEHLYCDICGETFNTQATLDVHKLNHLTTETYVCEICQHASKNREDYALHFQIHDQSNQAFSSCLNKKEKFPTLPFKCDMCNKTFQFSSSFKRHVEKHSLLHVCNICNASFPSQLLCHQHKLTHARKTLHKCEVCGKTFQRPHQLTIHMQVHESHKRYHCKECDTSYCYKTSLMRHVMKYHSPDSPRFQCHLCGELFKNKKTLNGHEILHTAKKLIECPDCSQTFKYRSSYHRHRVIHQGSKPFRCNACGKLFRSESVLRAHKSQHVMNDEFVCKLCDKSFAFESYLKKHMLVHEGKSDKNNEIDLSDEDTLNS